MTPIKAVISDFGGVLTSPLLDAFSAIQDSSGISLETSAWRWWRWRAIAAPTRCSSSRPGG